MTDIQSLLTNSNSDKKTEVKKVVKDTFSPNKDSLPKKEEIKPIVSGVTSKLESPQSKPNFEISKPDLKVKNPQPQFKKSDPKPKNPKSKKKVRYILGASLLVLLMVGLTATYWLTKQSQDIRQQASSEPYPEKTCEDSGGTVEVRNGITYCTFGGSADCNDGNTGGGDPCASNGGICAGTGVIRCQCGNAWVAVIGDSCAGACDGANLPCDGPNCDPSPDPSPRPTDNPSPRPTPTPSGSPSPTPSASPSPSPSVSPTPTPSVSPSPSASPSPTPTPSVSPSPTPTPSISPTPTPSASPSPTPEVTPSPDPVYTCNSDCSSNSQCQSANADYICADSYDDKCRLDINPASETCEAPANEYACNSSCDTNEQCQTASSSYICYQNNCRLDSNPGADNCQAATYTTASIDCNDSCVNNSDCSNSAHICYNNACRLATNPTSATCSEPAQQVAQVTKGGQPELPAELPQSGSNILLDWVKAGLGVLGIGAVLLLLL